MTPRWTHWVHAAAGIVGSTAQPLALLPLLVGRPGRLRLRTGLELELGHALDALVWKEIWLDDEYRLASLDAPGLVVDVGAGIGLFSIAVATRAPRCRLLACEPDPRQQPRLRANLERAGVADRVAVHECAVATHDRVRLHQPSAPARSQSTPLGRASNGPEVVVPGRPLSMLLAEHPGPVDLLKIDCEGAEGDVLASLDDATWPRVRRLALEVHEALRPGVGDEVERRLRDRGLRVERGPARRGTGLLYAWSPEVRW